MIWRVILNRNPGTYEGTLEEIELVKRINRKEFNSFFEKNLNVKKFLALRITENKFSELSKLNVMPKSDICLINYEDKFKDILKAHDFFLDEKILQSLSLNYISRSGISVKLKNSNKYQIHKFTVNSFLKIFGNKFLGAGAMIYTKNEQDLIKNNHIIEKIWRIPEVSFWNYFLPKFSSLNNMDLKQKYILIQKFSLKELKLLVEENIQIKEHIFTGKNDFDEPFCATFSFINNQLKNFEFTDFSFTTGSSRIKSPTIVVKPKN